MSNIVWASEHTDSTLIIMASIWHSDVDKNNTIFTFSLSSGFRFDSSTLDPGMALLDLLTSHFAKQSGALASCG